MIKYTTHEVSSHILTPEGSQCVLQGSHEYRVWAALPSKGEGKPFTALGLKKSVGDETAKVGQGRAFKSGWIGKEGDGFVKLVSRSIDAMWSECIRLISTDIICRRYYTTRLAGNWFDRNIESWRENTSGSTKKKIDRSEARCLR